MRCKFCRSKEVEVYLRSYGLALCREHFLQFFEKRVKSAIDKFRMFSKQDSIIVAVSGGKDSLALLHVLHKMGYEVEGYFLDLGIPSSSEKARSYVERFSQQFGVPIKIEILKESFGFSLLEISRVIKRPACSFCGIIKRYFMNNAARGAVLATGHTLYDEATTLLANVLQWKLGYLARQYPVLYEQEGFSRRVKPFVFVSERETAIYCFFNDIDYLMETCPLSKGATSRVYKRHLLDIEADMPGTIIRFLKGFYSTKSKLEFPDEARQAIMPCQICGYPTTAAGICSVCRIKEKLTNRRL